MQSINSGDTLLISDDVEDEADTDADLEARPKPLAVRMSPSACLGRGGVLSSPRVVLAVLLRKVSSAQKLGFSSATSSASRSRFMGEKRN